MLSCREKAFILRLAAAALPSDGAGRPYLFVLTNIHFSWQTERVCLCMCVCARTVAIYNLTRAKASRTQMVCTRSREAVHHAIGFMLLSRM